MVANRKEQSRNRDDEYQVGMLLSSSAQVNRMMLSLTSRRRGSSIAWKDSKVAPRLAASSATTIKPRARAHRLAETEIATSMTLGLLAGNGQRVARRRNMIIAIRTRRAVIDRIVAS